MKILLVLIFSGIASCLYRAGGMGYPFNRWHRRLGVPICAVAILITIGLFKPLWALILTFGLMTAVLTTYFKFGGQEDVYWHNWLTTGAMMGLSALPIAIATGKWIGFAIRTVLLAFLIMWWSEKWDDATVEEMGRGGLFCITLPLLLI